LSKPGQPEGSDIQDWSLARYAARRLLQAVPLVLGVLVLSFILIHLAPGDPIYLLAGDGGDAAYYTQMRAYYGLDRPLIVQLGIYLFALLHGDFGYSLSYHQPVMQVIFSRMWATLLLMGTALVLSSILGIMLGALTGTRPHSFIDRVATVSTLSVYSIPVFWLGQLLILLFAVWLQWLPVQGMVSARDEYTGILYGLDVLRHLALPALTLTLAQLALMARLTRTTLREVLVEDFIRTARAKGLSERIVIFRHALRNALLPLVTVIGSQIGFLLTGAALTETIFAWPGLGRLLLSATLNRDYPLLMALFILLTVTVILANLFTDLLYALLDP
jgi:peptide/nickel transport system permease protein